MANGGFKPNKKNRSLSYWDPSVCVLIRSWIGVNGLALLVILEPWVSRLFVWVLTLRGKTAGAAHKDQDHKGPAPKATPVNPPS